jgi:secreted Zn-dependent insulinase-like peptidase
MYITVPGHGRWLARAFGLVALLLLLQGAGQAAEVVKSPNDARQYEALTLPNGLRVLLVSDPTTELAAAALDVNVGYYSDPADRPGLAHFLEHMLFLGTQKYPDPESFREFMTSHGGGMNAYTAAEHTVFYFDVDRRYIDEAVDRFAQFFISPLFDEQYVQREMMAIESEYRLKIRDDSRRLLDVLRETVNPAHPFAKFSVGDVETLRDREGDRARDAVMSFYKSHYSANLMTLAVISAEPLDRMKALVTERLAAVPDRGLKPLAVEVPVATPEQMALDIAAVPLREQRELRFDFPYPWKDDYWLSKPGLLIAYVLGYEGKGSLHEMLKERGWINRIEAGASRLASNQGVFNLSMDLTAEGERHIDDIAAATFGYIRLVQRAGVGPGVHAELARIKRLDFQYREKGSPTGEAMAFAQNLQVYPPELAVFGPMDLANYDKAAVADILSRLRPDNVRMVVMAPDLPATTKSRYYHTPYAVRRLEPATLERWAQAKADPALAMPEPNRFLPEHARLKPVEAARDKPELLIDREGLSVWHLQDGDFRVPRADLFVTLQTPRASATARDAAMTALYLTLVKDSLNAATYPAAMAGLDYRLYRSLRGIGLSVSGYDEKQGLLTGMVLDGLLGFAIDPRDFAIQRRELIRQWDNTRLGSPYLRIFGELDDLLYFNRWSPEQLSAAMAHVSLADLKAFLPGLFSQLDIEVFVHGNLTAAEASALGQDIAGRVFRRAKPGPEVEREVALLSPGRRYLRSLDSTHDDSAVLVYYQAPDDRIETAAGFLLLEQVIKSPFFDTLRTQEQFGYVVSAQSTSALRLPGLDFVVQSPAKGTAVIAGRIDRFVHEFRERLAGMTDEAFDSYRQGLLTVLREKDTSLERRSQRLQASLALGDYGFDRRERLIAAVEATKKSDVLALYDGSLLAADSRRLVIQSAGNGRGGEALAAKDGFEALKDAAAFRRGIMGLKLMATREAGLAAADTKPGAPASAEPPASPTDKAAE